MKTCFSNATVMWNENEIIRRESLIREIPNIVYNSWYQLNRAVKIERIETPILTPPQYLQSHIDAKFELIKANENYLRPETTAGTFEAFNLKFSQQGQLKKILPYCLWQVGCSFRDEANAESMRATKLRLKQFYQLEMQLFCSEGTQAPYLETALDTLVKWYGGTYKEAEDLPHYSIKTLDWYMDELEVAGCSIRTDWPLGMVFEIAIGLDRLVALQTKV